MKRLVSILLLLSLLALPVAAQAGSPSDILQGAMDEVKSILNDPAYAGDDMLDAKEQKLVDIIKSLFNFELICRLTVANHWKQFSADEQARFVEAFEKLLQATYLQSILKNTDVTVTVVSEKELKTNKYEVIAEVTSSSTTEPVPMAFRMIFKDRWEVYDVVVEGVSLVKNYRTQFQELMQSSTPEDLINVVLDKTARAEAGELDQTGN